MNRLPKTESGPLPSINKSLLQARHLQVQLRERKSDSSLPREGELWSPATSGPFLVPVIRWFD